MPVTTGTPASTAPASPDALWLLAAMFKADWNDEIAVRSGFETAIENALSASEQRVGLKGLPVRSLSVPLQAHTPEQLRDLISAAARATLCRSLMPLVSDLTLIEEPVLAGSSTLSADTTLRRIFPLTRAAIIDPTSEPEAASFEIVEITGVSDDTITLADPLAANHPAGAMIVPLIESRLIPQSKGTAITDSIGTVTLEGVEAVGSTQLPLTAEIGVTPDEFDEYLGLPVLVPRPDFTDPVEWGFDRIGQFDDSGIDSVPTMEGDRGRWAIGIPFLCDSRETAWPLIRLFDSRAGRLHPLWLVSPLTEHTAKLVVGGGTSIKVTASGSVYDWSFRPYIALELSDGSVVLRKIDSVSRAAGLDQLTFDTGVTGLTLGAIVRVATVLQMRMTKDELEEQWVTNQVMRTRYELIELLDEKEIEITDLDVLESSDLAEQFVLGQCDGHPFFDSFNRANGDLGADWDETHNGVWTIDGNEAVPNTGGVDDNYATYSGWTAYTDVIVEAVVNGNMVAAVQVIGLTARQNSTGSVCYMAQFQAGGGDLSIKKNGSVVATVTVPSGAVTAGHVLRLRTIGGAIRAEFVGTIYVLTYTDGSPLAAGRCGMFTNFSSTSATGFDDFRITDFGS